MPRLETSTHAGGPGAADGRDVSGQGRKQTLVALASRYGPTSISSACISAAHFLVQFAILHALGAYQIGLVAFVLTLMQFAMGISNALVATPYSVLAHQHGGGERAILPVNLVLCLGIGIAAGLIVLIMDTQATAICFGVSIALTTMRWFGRTHAICIDNGLSAAASDILYAAVLVTCTAIGLVSRIDMDRVALWFVAASLTSLLPFARPLWRLHHAASLPSFAAYRPIWREQARWSLTGVATSEATANCHTYLVTAFAGPTALAPLAVGALFLRPLGVCITAMTQIERPRMARDLAGGNKALVNASVRHFRAILLLIWAATVAGAFTLLVLRPSLVEKAGVDHGAVLIAVALCGLTAAAQCMMTPWSVLLQAADRFKPLALISVRASILTLAGAVLILALLAPVASLAAVLAGQLFIAVGTFIEVRKWRQTPAPSLPPVDQQPATMLAPLA